jgi:hypothetical protein
VRILFFVKPELSRFIFSFKLPVLPVAVKCHDPWTLLNFDYLGSSWYDFL